MDLLIHMFIFIFYRNSFYMFIFMILSLSYPYMPYVSLNYVLCWCFVVMYINCVVVYGRTSCKTASGWWVILVKYVLIKKKKKKLNQGPWYNAWKPMYHITPHTNTHKRTHTHRACDAESFPMSMITHKTAIPISQPVPCACSNRPVASPQRPMLALANWKEDLVKVIKIKSKTN